MPRAAKTPIAKVKTAPPTGKKATKTQPQKRGASARRPLLLPAVRERGINTGTNAAAEMIDVSKPLTQMQKDFVKHWAAGESITSASHRAGYADGATFAYRMTKMPNVLALYNEEKRLYEEASGMTRKKVMDMLKDAYDDAKMVNEPASMVSAAREIGKMCGYYEPVVRKIEVSVAGASINERLNRMSDADLLKLITADEMEDAGEAVE
jgi:hypothetical protein